LFVLSPLIVGWVFWHAGSDDRRVLAIRGAAAMLLALLFAKGAGALYPEPRPFVVHHRVPLIPHAPDNGFPSDHTLLTFACAFLVLPFSLPAALAGMAVATAVGLARVASDVHTPLDFVASLLFAALANFLAWRLIPPRAVRAHKNLPVRAGIQQTDD
jgi:undecaprenyl-diphosphatase